jgi:hypothetical protein
MNTATTVNVHQIPVLLRGDTDAINEWIQRWSAQRMLLYVAVIVIGAGLFGAAVGSWRGDGQTMYAALKLPMIVLLTALGNALLNAMLAPLLGLSLGLRQSLLAILMSFTIAAAILGAFSPLMFFLVWNTSPLAERAHSSTAHSAILLSQVAVIAFAGVAANLRLAQLLRRLSGSAAVARKILLAWLGGNLLLGSQLAWILRPFIGSPDLSVQFLRQDALRGSFFEAVWNALHHLLF